MIEFDVHRLHFDQVRERGLVARFVEGTRDRLDVLWRQRVLQVSCFQKVRNQLSLELLQALEQLA